MAFAVGAAIGAALPHSDVEDELLGDASQRAKDVVKSGIRDVAERGEEAASEIYGDVREAATAAQNKIKERVELASADEDRSPTPADKPAAF